MSGYSSRRILAGSGLVAKAAFISCAAACESCSTSCHSSRGRKCRETSHPHLLRICIHLRKDAGSQRIGLIWNRFVEGKFVLRMALSLCCTPCLFGFQEIIVLCEGLSHRLAKHIMEQCYQPQIELRPRPLYQDNLKQALPAYHLMSCQC